jgi:enoyl-CoA hydratase/carnithine racemase
MIPGVVGTQTAPRIGGEGRALHWILAGAPIDAPTARRIGMVGSVVPPVRLRGEAERLARRLVKIDKDLVSAVKRLVHRGLDLDLDGALAAERTVASRLNR